MPQTRRTFLKSTAVTLGVGLVARPRLYAGPAAEPHFFLNLLFRPGWDPSYLCDARPLAMTRAGKIQNYLGEEPTPLTGANGGKTLVTRHFAPLRPYFDRGRLSILNGVHMAATFDGHDQNLNVLLTGNAFGGDSYIPYLNDPTVPGGGAPLDYLLNGHLYGAILNNVGKGVALSPDSAKSLTAAARAVGAFDPASPSLRYLMDRFQAAAAGGGRFAQGAAALQQGLQDAGSLSDRMRSIDLDLVQDEPDLVAVMKLVTRYFTAGIARSAVVEVESYNLDTHDPESAKRQAEVYGHVTADIKTVLDGLGPLLDQTTVAVSSEFGRTMRQQGLPIDATGTDHNPLSNSVLLAGKGIKGGLVIGASDQRTGDETLSGAHKQLDENLVKTMGLPFDFQTGRPRGDQPAAYDPKDYLTFASVGNSLMRLFGVPASRYWAVERNGPAAVVMTNGPFTA